MCCFWWWLLIIITLLIILTQLSSTLKFYIKYASLCLSYIFLTAVCGLFSLINPGSSENLYIAQFFMWLLHIEELFGFKIEVEDWDTFKNVDRPVVIVSNHQALIDAHIMLKSSPNGTAPLAKKSLLYVPIFGVVSWLYGTLFINRSKGKSTIEMLRKVGNEMKEKNTSVWIFAEGTRKQEDKVTEFKKGGFHLAIQAQVPIIPVVIGNYRNVIDRKNKLFEGGTIRVKPLAPIPTTGLAAEDVDDLIAKVHKVISDGYEEDFQQHQEVYKDLIPLKNK